MIAMTTTDWPTLAAQARAALRWWDVWCPDDGRPQALCDILCAYVRGCADTAELERAMPQIMPAWWQLAGGLLLMGKDTPQYHAWRALCLLNNLGLALLYPSLADRFLRQAQADADYLSQLV